MSEPTNPHRPGTKAHARWAERLAKNQAKSAALKAELERRQTIVERARDAVKLPSDFVAYDYTRTHAWKAATAVLRAKLEHARLQPGGGGATPGMADFLQRQTALVLQIGTMTGTRLAEVIRDKGKA